MLALLLAVIQPLSCHIVKSNWIYGRDLATASPALAAIAPDAQIGLSPMPGQQRTFRASELKRIALANHLDFDNNDDVCFAWDVSIPDRKQMQAAMEKSLAGRQPSVEIVESSLMPAPEGEMVFPLSGLMTGSDKPSVWRGYVRYADTRQFQVWARVLVKVREQRVVTTAELQAGDELRRDELKVNEYEGPVTRERFLLDLSEAEGLLLRRSLPMGVTLVADMLESPREVNKGDMVSAVVQTGAARLVVQGVAESDGRKGQVISVRNPRSGRSFHARVEDKDSVTVVPGGQFGLVVEPKKS
ncbi:MAG: flagellar basal body P-ring formation chaperone FlgA [Acidobacteriota bacterium]|nr:flagellar basal body P-ring formation chaperone FlgA [Acidobacteriota bacterium]